MFTDKISVAPSSMLSGIPFHVTIFLIGVIFLPFTKALTVNIGFPLKIYEILFSVCVIMLVFRLSSIDKRLYRIFLFPLIIFLVLTCTSSVIAVLVGFPESGISFRGGAFIDMLTRNIYLLFNIGVFIIAYELSSRYSRLFSLLWLTGMSLSVLYMIYCTVSLNIIGHSYLLPGLERHQTGSIGAMAVSRSGTFEEGNFAGLYFLFSYAIAGYSKMRIFSILSVLGIMLTLSTSAFIGFAMMIILDYYHRSSYKNKNIILGVFIVLFVIMAFAVFDVSEKFEFRPGQSFVVRLNEIMTGLKIFMANPLFGVGLGQYGYHFIFYNWHPAYEVYTGTLKRIPNNVYIEVLSELGIAGFTVFILFWLRWAKGLSKQLIHQNVLSRVPIAMFIIWLAYPSFNITFLWCFAGFALAVQSNICFSGNHKNV